MADETNHCTLHTKKRNTSFESWKLRAFHLLKLETWRGVTLLLFMLSIVYRRVEKLHIHPPCAAGRLTSRLALHCPQRLESGDRTFLPRHLSACICTSLMLTYVDGGDQKLMLLLASANHNVAHLHVALLGDNVLLVESC